MIGFAGGLKQQVDAMLAEKGIATSNVLDVDQEEDAGTRALEENAQAAEEAARRVAEEREYRWYKDWRVWAGIGGGVLVVGGGSWYVFRHHQGRR